MQPIQMRTGLLSSDGSHDNDMMDRMLALLNIFAKDAISVSEKYARAHGRKKIRAYDMHAALKYCARMFFQNNEHNLHTLIDEMMQEETDNDSEEETDDDTDETLSDSEIEMQEIDERDVQLAKQVDTIVSTWELWDPTDVIQQIIKRAIDNTPIE